MRVSICVAALGLLPVGQAFITPTSRAPLESSRRYVSTDSWDNDSFLDALSGGPPTEASPGTPPLGTTQGSEQGGDSFPSASQLQMEAQDGFSQQFAQQYAQQLPPPAQNSFAPQTMQPPPVTQGQGPGFPPQYAQPPPNMMQPGAVPQQYQQPMQPQPQAGFPQQYPPQQQPYGQQPPIQQPPIQQPPIQQPPIQQPPIQQPQMQQPPIAGYPPQQPAQMAPPVVGYPPQHQPGFAEAAAQAAAQTAYAQQLALQQQQLQQQYVQQQPPPGTIPPPQQQQPAPPQGTDELPSEEMADAVLTEEMKAKAKASHTLQEEASGGGQLFRSMMARAKQKAAQQPQQPVLQQQPPQQQPPLQIPPNAMELSVEEQAKLFREIMSQRQQQQLGAAWNPQPASYAQQQLPSYPYGDQSAAPQFLPPGVGYDGRKLGRNKDADMISSAADVYLAQLKVDSSSRRLAREAGDVDKSNAVFHDPKIQEIKAPVNPYREKQKSMVETIPEEMLLFQEYGDQPDAKVRSYSGVNFKEQLAAKKAEKKAQGGGSN